MFYAYILKCSDDSYYVGSSDDPDRRLIEHNQGKGSDWTAARRPVAIVWIEEHATLSSLASARIK
jgi:predicted GIY-YIG superfamily endonuclease